MSIRIPPGVGAFDCVPLVVNALLNAKWAGKGHQAKEKVIRSLQAILASTSHSSVNELKPRLSYGQAGRCRYVRRPGSDLITSLLTVSRSNSDCAVRLPVASFNDPSLIYSSHWW